MKHYIRILKSIDLLLKPLLRFIPGVSHHNKAVRWSTMRIIRPGGMGDAALLLPSIKRIKHEKPGLSIDILCESRNKGVFDSVDYVDHVMCYHDFSSLFRVCTAQYDVIIDTEQSHYLSSILARFIPSSIKIGFAVNGRDRLFHKSVDYCHDRYEANMFWALFDTLSPEPRPFAWDFPYFRKMNPASCNALQSFDEIMKKIVCIFPGATVTERLWPVERWAQVIDSVENMGYQAVLLGGKMEVDQNREILAQCKSRSVMDMTKRLSLLETTWLFGRSHLLVSTDSGILHLGVLCDMTTVSLFGSGISAKWAPRGDKHTVITLDLPCSPCTRFGETPPCPHENRCMLGITSGTVIKALNLMMN